MENRRKKTSQKQTKEIKYENKSKNILWWTRYFGYDFHATLFKCFGKDFGHVEYELTI